MDWDFLQRGHKLSYVDKLKQILSTSNSNSNWIILLTWATLSAEQPSWTVSYRDQKKIKQCNDNLQYDGSYISENLMEN